MPKCFRRHIQDGNDRRWPTMAWSRVMGLVLLVAGCGDSPQLPTSALPVSVGAAGRFGSGRSLADAPCAPQTRSAERSGPKVTAPARSAGDDENWQPTAPAHAWKYLVLHHTATEAGSVASINEEHRHRTDANGQPWRGIGYHFVIGNGHGMEDGAVEATFRWQQQLAGAHSGSEDYNTNGIGICLVGNFEHAPPTEAQVAALKQLLAVLRDRFAIDRNHVVRHRDVKATACPGRFFPWDEVAAGPTASQFAGISRPPDRSVAALRERERAVQAAPR